MAVEGASDAPHIEAALAASDYVVAIKVAPFDRYRTLDVVSGVIEAGAEQRIALYTGNDDSILLDLLTPYELRRHLFELGLGVAEAMDTAQRGMGLDRPASQELIRQSLAAARAIPGVVIACGAGTDHLPPEPGQGIDADDRGCRHGPSLSVPCFSRAGFSSTRARVRIGQ